MAPDDGELRRCLQRRSCINMLVSATQLTPRGPRLAPSSPLPIHQYISENLALDSNPPPKKKPSLPFLIFTVCFCYILKLVFACFITGIPKKLQNVSYSFEKSAASFFEAHSAFKHCPHKTMFLFPLFGRISMLHGSQTKNCKTWIEGNWLRELVSFVFTTRGCCAVLLEESYSVRVFFEVIEKSDLICSHPQP